MRKDILRTSAGGIVPAKVHTQVEQHSIFYSILLHLLPGALITITFILLGPWLKQNHLPPLLAILIPILIVLIPFELGWLFYHGYRRNGTLSLNGIEVDQAPLPLKDYLINVPLLSLWSVLIFMSLGGLDQVILNSLFNWLPGWFQIGRISPGEFSQPILTITFGLFLVLNGFAGPVVEELYFRGYLLPRIEYLKGWAPLINVLLFSLYHFFSPWQFFTRVLAFYPLACVVRRKNNTFIGIAAHCLLNIGYCLLSFKTLF